MNILFVSALLPYPLHSGGQVRIYNLLKRLSKRHSITLVAFIRDERERDLIKNLKFCRSVHVVMRGRAWQATYLMHAVLGPFPFLLSTYHNWLAERLITDLLGREHYDLVHIEPFYVWPSLPKLTVPLVVSEHNVEYDVYHAFARRFPWFGFRSLLHWDVGKIEKWERTVWRAADALTAVSVADQAVMEEYLSHPVTLVPNGVDLEAFPYRKPPKRNNPTVLFAGNFRWVPNRDAAETLVCHIWPLVSRRFPQAQLLVAGQDIPSVLRSRIKEAGGRVEDHVADIASVYQRADMLVAPHAISGGTKFKMLEAMATGTPVITTPEGVFGLDVEPGVHYFEAVTSEEFAAQISYVWDNTARREIVAGSARKRIEEHYDWNSIAGLLEQVWKNAYAKK